MDNLSFDNSTINISNAVIKEINSETDTTFVTISYSTCDRCSGNTLELRLVVSDNTIILDELGNPITVSTLQTDMTINAIVSSATTRSIPPQSNAFLIQIVNRPMNQNIYTGRIINIDRENRNFTAINDGNISSTIRFNVPMTTRIFDIFGRPISFNRLMPGMRVRGRHADFMTASIPPQTTAFEIRVVR